MEPDDEWTKWMRIGLLVIISYFVLVLMPQFIGRVWG